MDGWIQSLHTLNALVHVEVEVWKRVHLSQNKSVRLLEHQWVLQWLVVALWDREDHHLQTRAGIKLSRADQVADILQENQVQAVVIHSVQCALTHTCVHVAHAVGVGLDCGCAHGLDLDSVHVRSDVRLHDADFHLGLQVGHGLRQQCCLA